MYREKEHSSVNHPRLLRTCKIKKRSRAAAHASSTLNLRSNFNTSHWRLSASNLTGARSPSTKYKTRCTSNLVLFKEVPEINPQKPSVSAIQKSLPYFVSFAALLNTLKCLHPLHQMLSGPVGLINHKLDYGAIMLPIYREQYTVQETT